MRQKQSTHGSDFGDFPSLAVEPVDLEFRPDTTWETLGFRIVHDESDRVYRGGSWNYTADYARAANRNWDFPGYRSDFLGLRLVYEREDT